MSDEFAMVLILIVICGILLIRRIQPGAYKQDVFIGPGFHVVGQDIPPGKADMIAEEGGGEFSCREKGSKVWNYGNKIGVTSGVQPSRIRNLYLNPGDTLEINGNVNVMLTAPVPITDIRDETLGPGNYRFGIDVPVGKYNLETVSGDGQVYLFRVGEKEYSFYQDMDDTHNIKASEFVNVLCVRGDVMWIEGNLQIRLVHSKHQPLIFRRPKNP